MTTTNIVLLIVAVASQVVATSLYLNAHFKGPLLDPLDYYLLRRKLPKLFRLEMETIQTEPSEVPNPIFVKAFKRPATIFEKADFLKTHLSLKLRSKRFKRKLFEAIDDYAEKLTLDEEYSDGAISAIASHIQNTHKPNM